MDFSNTPIKLNVYNRHGDLVKIHVLLGHAPDDVRKAIMQYKKSKSGTKTLEKYYGKDWKAKLAFTTSVDGGGNNDDDDDDGDGDDDVDGDSGEAAITELEKVEEAESNFNFDFEERIPNLKDGVDIADISQIETEPHNVTPPSIVDPDEYNHVTRATERIRDSKLIGSSDSTYSDPEDESQESTLLREVDDILDGKKINLIQVGKTKTPTPTPTLIGKASMPSKFTTVEFVDMYVDPSDNVYTFKKKISLILNMPIYRQHIWVLRNSITHPLSYKIEVASSLIDVDIRQMMNFEGEQVENIPIIQKSYQMKDEIIIKGYDSFKIMDSYLHRGEVSFNVIDINEFMPSRDILNTFAKDKYKLELVYFGFVILFWPMITLSVFSEFIIGPIDKFYPDLHPDEETLKKGMQLSNDIFVNRSEILSNPVRLNMIQSKLESSITYSMIRVSSEIEQIDILSLRNLFDLLELSAIMPWCKCILSRDYYSNFIFEKTFRNTKGIGEVITTPSVVIKLVPDGKSVQYMQLNIYSNGNYTIKSFWREEQYYGFDDIHNAVAKMVNPLLTKINKLHVFFDTRRLRLMDKNNSKFSEINTSIFYRRAMTDKEFIKLEKQLRIFQEAGFIDGKDSDGNTLEYYFTKGMYQHDISRIDNNIQTKNYYEYLSDGNIKQKWDTIFRKTRLTKFMHRFSDVRIDISGVKEKEFPIFYGLIITLLYMYEKNAGPLKSKPDPGADDSEIKVAKKKLTHLKDQDPLLYDFKKIYKSNVIYSKKCQKAYQPSILSRDELGKLTAGQKNKMVKYWNFTTNEPAYYTCPNPKYPYIKFMVKEHPKDYCIPCCKKTPVSTDSTNPRTIIHNICLKDHVYAAEKKTITVGSKYIMSYGKDVEQGRLSKLPEHSIEPLFYETYSTEGKGGVDKECDISDGYYIYGVNQTTRSMNNVGYIYCISHGLDRPVSELLRLFLDKLVESPHIFKILIGGKTTYYFKGFEQFIDVYRDIFLNDTGDIELFPDWYSEVPWNDIFIHLTRLFLQINTVHFYDNGRDVILRVPVGITSSQNYLIGYKNIIVIQKKKKFYPIYLLNVEVFFKASIIDVKLFSDTNSIIKNIQIIVKKNMNSLSKGLVVKKNLDLHGVMSFAKSSKYKITKLYVNKADMCWGVTVNGCIFVPVYPSHYTPHDNIEYSPLNRKKDVCSFKQLNDFLWTYNKWVNTESEQKNIIPELPPVYPNIQIQKWIQLGNHIIGFIDTHRHMWYFQPINPGKAMKIKKTGIYKMLFDPYEVNLKIYKQMTNISTTSTTSKDSTKSNTNTCLYNYYLYKLFLLKFMEYLSTKKNTSVRRKIKKAILMRSKEKSDETLRAILDDQDYQKIKTQWVENKKVMFANINLTNYNFDKTRFDEKTQDQTDAFLKTAVRSFTKIITPSEVKNIEFTNIYTDKSANFYDKSGSLKLTKHRLDDFIEILSSDLRNPTKSKWIFEDVLADPTVKQFQFIRRLDEKIFISIGEKFKRYSSV